MSNFAENKKEKVFEYYLNFPPELQIMVVDEMRADDRCRFTRCSKLSRKQAMSSKNFIHSIIIDVEIKDNHFVEVWYSDPKKKPLFGCVLMFDEYEGKKWMKYLNSDWDETSRTELCPTTDLLQLALETIKRLLGEHQNTIKKLSIYGQFLGENRSDFDFGITRLNNLKSVYVHSSVDFQQIFSKLRRPLENLEIGGNANNVFNSCSQEICQVKGTLILRDIELNREEFLRLSASHIKMSIGKLTEIDIFEIINSWRNGEIGNKKINYEWWLIFSKFKVRQFVRLFGAEYNDGSRFFTRLEIKHNKDSTKKATIEYKRDEIRFST